jgi:HD domain
MQMLTFTPSFLFLPPKTVQLSAATMFYNKPDFHDLLRPETELEVKLLDTPVFQEGLDWGKPRFGHPEGKVGYHVREVLDNVDKIAQTPADRQQLRLIAIVHDTFKFKEFELGRRVKHHGLLAREFMEAHTTDPALLNIIELHDEAFYCWRNAHLEQQPHSASLRLEKLLEALDGTLPLYLDFYKCDTQTGDKVQAPLYWFEQVVSAF